MNQVKEFKYLWDMFASEGKLEHKITRQISAAQTVLQALYRTIVVKMEDRWNKTFPETKFFFRSEKANTVPVGTWSPAGTTSLPRGLF